MSIAFSLPPLATNGFVYAFKNSDFVGQSICVGLFLFSIVIWVVMLEKCMTLKKAARDTAEFIRQFKENKSPLFLKNQAENDRSPAARVFEAACARIDEFRIELPGSGRRALRDDELEVLKGTVEQAVEEQIVMLEKRMIVISTAVSAGPFLGLFGTVWGITIAFTNLALIGRADIQTLAPGVSGALLTTVIALFVAIPSLVFYNIISSQLKNLTVRLDNFASEIVAQFKIEQLEAILQAGRERK
ncbi:MAG: MotA/TolQ/ExbB proton channel family protein [Lentisphaeria bacterium]|nr:MotA/TolQ/ExbB proton channel family protein [Lentisphaeria bacterium]